MPALELDKWEESVKNMGVLTSQEMLSLLSHVQSILFEESNLHSVQLPVTICGDIHGQFPDLLHLFELAGQPDSSGNTYNYVFLGDLVDRGFNSVEVLTFLLILKAKIPDRITLIRGNHETRRVSATYGFYDECFRKFKTPDVWRQCTELFDMLPISALVDGTMLCLHGGLSPEIRSLHHIQLIPRFQEIPETGALSDLVWSDPEDIPGWAISTRGAGYLFGPSVLREFMHRNHLTFVARAHQLVQEGYRYYFDEKLLCTVWSAPNYCYRCNNLASVLQINEDRSRHFVVFKEVECQQPDAVSQTTTKATASYFV